MIKAVKLPELGENVEEGEVLAVLVAVGDHIESDQTLIEIETNKASVEVPAPIPGVVKAVHVKPGDIVHVGGVIAEVETEAEGSGAEVAEAAVDAAAETESVAVAAAQPPAPAVAAPPAVDEHAETAPAAPSVRRLARELGLDINDVAGSGPGGHISEQDVMQHARRLIQERVQAPRGIAAAPAGSLGLPDFSRFGAVEREPMSGVRRKTAQTMSRSWVTIPHVTQFDRADITETERARKHYASQVAAQGGKLTLTAVVIKILAAAVKLYPKFNASIDTDHDEIVLKQYVNIGVAVDTDHGLLVPVIRDVDQKHLTQIGRELTELSDRARARKSRPEDLQGANLTVTNLGSLGTTYFSPLINWPEVAVLGIGRANQEALYRDGAFVPRLMLPLSVSYDHRLIDGADAARFLRWIAEALEHPLALALDG
ncbi:MAG: catalytic domain of component of various dehydrogenase complexe [Deltaproteobacteria bacterium]|nr:catalytic domain of component of various dehydrogenase complexe [Deltaproteobacteria bacterium]